MTEEELEDWLKAFRDGRESREWHKLLTRRTRIRMAWHRKVNQLGTWLVDHGRIRAACILWRIKLK